MTRVKRRAGAEPFGVSSTPSRGPGEGSARPPLRHAMTGTQRLYLDDDHTTDAVATVVAVRGSEVACDRSCFYPGGGGQPPDRGVMVLPDGRILPVDAAFADPEGIVWHVAAEPVPADLVGVRIRLCVDRARRQALSRQHTALHVLNTIALRAHDAWITGAQIGTDVSRIDFKIDGLSPALCAALERAVNAVIGADHPVSAMELPEAEFRARGDLLRTLEARPPVRDGRVRVVAIEGFDAQACGGTHVRSTAEIGRFSIVRTENKGRINKRLYVRLEALAAPPSEAAGRASRASAATAASTAAAPSTVKSASTD